MVLTRTNRGLPTRRCLRILGLSLLSEWDVLAFVAQHSVSLIHTKQVALLSGCDCRLVNDALESLERKQLIERLPASEGVYLCRLRIASEAEPQCCLAQLMRLSQSRIGRLHIAKQFKASPWNHAKTTKQQTVESRTEGVGGG